IKGGRTAKSSSSSAERWWRLMRVACSASLRVTPLETRACLSVSPKTLIATIRLPSPRHTNAQGPSAPLLHRIGFLPFGQPNGPMGYCQLEVASPRAATTGVAVARLLLSSDRAAGSLARETRRQRRRARHRQRAATNRQSPTDTVRGHLQGQAAGS